LCVLNLLSVHVCVAPFYPKFRKIFACFSFNCTYHCVVNLLAQKGEEKTISVTNIILKTTFIVTKHRGPASWKGSHNIITNARYENWSHLSETHLQINRKNYFSIPYICNE
jgi:hypothetical protein